MSGKSRALTILRSAAPHDKRPELTGGFVQAQPTDIRTNIGDIEQQWKKLAGRDLQLWSIAFLVMLVMLSGVLSQLAPAFFHGQTIVKIEYRYVPVLALGLIALVLLLNFYLIGQRRALDLVRYDLIREMASNQSLQQVAMIDPETQFFSRSAISRVLAAEISRSNRFGSDLTFVVFAADNFQRLRLKESPFTADRMIIELANILRQTFRGSDTLFRYSKSEFLLVMPKTSILEASPALHRLIDNLDHWNMSGDAAFELSLDYGIAAYKSGEPIDVALKAAELHKKSLLTAKSQSEESIASHEKSANRCSEDSTAGVHTLA